MRDTLTTVKLKVDRETIRRYAEITEDNNPIHIDPDFAAKTPMGGIIAHGTLSMNLILQAVEATFGGQATAGSVLDVRFLKPVREGDTVEAGGSRDPEVSASFRVWISNQDGIRVIEGTADVPGAAF
jgi:3-hydroxybutyryl-CoA dehydratase